MWLFWLIVSGIFFAFEIITVGFLLFWFAIGALIAMIISFFISNIYIQSIVFLVSSTILLFFTRPLAKKITKNSDSVNTNAFSIVGKRGIVLKDINSIAGTGQVKIGTEVWSAKSYSKEHIATGSEVEVVEIDGVKAVVK